MSEVDNRLHRTRIKFCGITRAEDARAAVNAGADAIGLVFYSGSRRKVTQEQAEAIIRELPPFVSVVGLFVNAEAEEVAALTKALHLDCLQFHGDETPAFCEQFGRRWIKAIRVKSPEVVANALGAYHRASALLLDAYDPNEYGGTGKTFNWDWVLEADINAPVILAGGLTPDNVAEAIGVVRPWAVDVSGGVEEQAGIKSAQRMHEFSREVRRGDQTD